MLQWLGAIGGIVLADLVLSGDNALVIGATAARLPRKQRLLVILCGGGGAVLLRIIFAALVTFLFQLPLIGVVGGVILLFIALKLLWERSSERRKTEEEKQNSTEALKHRGSHSFIHALLTIMVADLTMSLDNVLAVGAIAEGRFDFLIVGLLLSIGLIFVGSTVIAELINRLPWLLDVACLVLAWTASNILLGDDSLNNFFAFAPWIEVVVPIITLAIVFIVDVYLLRRDKKYQRASKT